MAPPAVDPGPWGFWRFWALVFRKSARQGRRIRAITLFRLEGSYLFAQSDIVSVVWSRGEGGEGRRRKPIALPACLFIRRPSREKQENTAEGGGGPLEVGASG